MGVSTDDTPNFFVDADLPRSLAGVRKEAMSTGGGRPTCQEAAALRSGDSSSRPNPTPKGGITAVAKKAAKGGKKKGGKKR